MSLKESVKEAVIEQLAKFEGRVDHFYLNSKGIASVGIGQLVLSEDVAASLPLYIPRMLKWWLRSATDEEKRAEYQFVQLNGPDNPSRYKASYYKQFTRLIMLDKDMEAILIKNIDSLYGELSLLYNETNGYLSNFADFPDEVQLALFDMIFNLGMTNLRTSWPKLNGAIKVEDWKTAAAESRRRQVSPVRNNYVRDLFLLAHQKQQGIVERRSKAS